MAKLKEVHLASGLAASFDSVAAGANATVAGLLTHRFAANGTNVALGTTVQVVKASEGRLYAYEIRNVNANVMYVHIFDSSSVTLGTTSPLLTIAVPGGSATAPGIARLAFSPPVTFGTAIRMAATTSDDHTGTTAPGTGLSGVVYYK